MASRIIIDPVSRIHGHLRIEVEIEAGRVRNAWSSGMLYRGFETILKGRNLLDAPPITQRICGVCTYVHLAASVKAIEEAVKVKAPANARLLRNLLLAAQHIHDHPIHFYHLATFDWVDPMSALNADPKKTSALAGAVSNAPGQGVKDFAAARDRLSALVKSGQLGPLNNGCWGHPAYKLPPEANLLIIKHYLDAIKNQVKAARLQALFGAKNPHIQSVVPGGVTNGHDLNAERLSQFLFMLQEQIDFVKNVYLPDVLVLAANYKEWAEIGGFSQFMACGEFPQGEVEPKELWQPRGIIRDRKLKVLPFLPAKITEDVKSAWYENIPPAPPSQGATNPLEGAGLSVDGSVSVDGKYSWIKAPRYEGQAFEVGPLARTLVSYGAGHTETKKYVDYLLKNLSLPPTALFSTLGRIMARVVNCLVIAEEAGKWVMDLSNNLKKSDQKSYHPWEPPKGEVEGFGLMDVPRGVLGHWVRLKDGLIDRYQIVAPTTWNFSPRDTKGQAGPLEEALVGTPVADQNRPLEILRTIHAFDPCLTCAVHVIDLESHLDRRATSLR